MVKWWFKMPGIVFERQNHSCTSRHRGVTEPVGLPSRCTFKTEAYLILALSAAASARLFRPVCWPEGGDEMGYVDGLKRRRISGAKRTSAASDSSCSHSLHF